MVLPDRGQIRRVRDVILRWYGRHRRELAWRTTTDPYRILVSEIMLQQTQVARVREKFPQFLRRFPTLRSLAAASRADVLRAWQGMGYNNRAIRLRDLARQVLDQHGGILPGTVDGLRTLPGIGRYTSHAMLCFAHGRRVPVVDVNVRRVLSRIFRRMRTPHLLMEEEDVWRLDALMLPRDASTWHQALMDLGSTICLARRPACDRCPVSKLCRSSHLVRVAPSRRPQNVRPEPAYAGTPRRIWRGKIVEQLRTLPAARYHSLRRVVAAIKPGVTTTDLRWFAGLVRALERDGLVATRTRDNALLLGLPEP